MSYVHIIIRPSEDAPIEANKSVRHTGDSSSGNSSPGGSSLGNSGPGNSSSCDPQDWAQITFRSEMHLNDYNESSSLLKKGKINFW